MSKGPPGILPAAPVSLLDTSRLLPVTQLAHEPHVEARNPGVGRDARSVSVSQGVVSSLITGVRDLRFPHRPPASVDAFDDRARGPETQGPELLG
jgi:hypothetical protein